MGNIIEQLNKEEIARLAKNIPVFAPGDTVIVNVNVVEGESAVSLAAGKKAGSSSGDAVA